MTYNLTAFEQSDNIAQMFLGINDTSGGILSGMLLIAIFFIFTVLLIRNNPPAESILSSSAITTIISLILLAMDAIGIEWVIGFGVIFGISAVALYINKN